LFGTVIVPKLSAQTFQKQLMKKQILTLFLLLFLPHDFSVNGQEKRMISERTIEQEAFKQTEMLKQELDLSAEQSRQMYEINLRYARMRQEETTRTKAMERIKNKNTEIQQILNNYQKERLLNKQYERSNLNKHYIVRPGFNR
jgi:hypothetical protein